MHLFIKNWSDVIDLLIEELLYNDFNHHLFMKII